MGGAAFFDLDKTVIARSCTLAFGGPLYRHGLINRRTVVRGAYAQLVFSLAGADEAQMDRLSRRIAALCTGWDTAQIREIVAETLDELIRPLVYAGAVDLIEGHQEAGRDVVIVSSSGAEMVEPIGAMLGVDDVIATRMVERAGRYTGEFAFYAYGPHKASAARELARARGYDLAASYAYSDSVTDLPLLETVGHPVAVNPDRALRRVAVERGWPVLDLDHAVPLHRRLHVSRRQVGNAVSRAAVGVAGLTRRTTRRAG